MPAPAPSARPAVLPDAPDGKPVTAWYRSGRGYLCGGSHLALAADMVEDGTFVPPPEDEGEAYFSSMQREGWLRVGVIGTGAAAVAFVAGHGIGHRSETVRRVVGDLLDIGAVGFHTRLEVTDEACDRHHHGEVLDSL